MTRTEAVATLESLVALAGQTCQADAAPADMPAVAAALRAMPGLTVIEAGGALPSSEAAVAGLVAAGEPVTLTLPPMTSTPDVVLVTAGEHCVAILPADGEEISGGDRPKLQGGTLSFAHLRAAPPWGWELIVGRSVGQA